MKPFAIFACLTLPATVSCAAQRTKPNWIERGSGVLRDERAFVGVGKADAIRNAQVRRSVAESRARLEVAKVLDSFVSAVLRLAGEGLRDETEEWHAAQALQGITNAGLNSVTVLEYWEDANGTGWAIAHLSLSDYQVALRSSTEVPALFRERVAEQMPAAFDHLAR
jgi:hypothetical protein